MGVKGPVPKRSAERRRSNEPPIPIVRAEGASNVVAPPADPAWHPVALAWYGSLAGSGQSQFYQPSDWATAVLIAESMSRDLLPQVVGVLQEGRDAGEVVKETIPLKGASLSAYLRAFAVLMVTEGDRRRLQIELARPQVDPDDARVDATVTDLRSRLGG